MIQNYEKCSFERRERRLFSFQHFNIIVNLIPFDVSQLQCIKRSKLKKTEVMDYFFVIIKLKYPRIRNCVFSNS